MPTASAPEPSPSTNRTKGGRTGAPDATAFPDSLFLEPSDFPGLPHRTAVEFRASSLNWGVILMCSGAAQDDNNYSSFRNAQTGRGLNYGVDPNGGADASGGPYATQRVVRFEADGAAKVFANVDAFHACRTGDGDRELARDFGGDQSRLYRLPPADRNDHRTRYLVFVRVGDLVTEIDLYGVTDDAGARELATRAARRLGS